MKTRIKAVNGFEATRASIDDLGRAIAAVAYFSYGLDQGRGTVVVLAYANEMAGFDGIHVNCGGQFDHRGPKVEFRRLLAAAGAKASRQHAGSHIAVVVSSENSATLRAVRNQVALDALGKARGLLGREPSWRMP